LASILYLTPDNEKTESSGGSFSNNNNIFKGETELAVRPGNG
jgi:hypothetical protein